MATAAKARGVPACGGTVGWNSRGLNVLFSHGVLGPRLCLGGDSLLACRAVYRRVCRVVCRPMALSS